MTFRKRACRVVAVLGLLASSAGPDVLLGANQPGPPPAASSCRRVATLEFDIARARLHQSRRAESLAILRRLASNPQLNGCLTAANRVAMFRELGDLLERSGDPAGTEVAAADGLRQALEAHLAGVVAFSSSPEIQVCDARSNGEVSVRAVIRLAATAQRDRAIDERLKALAGVSIRVSPETAAYQRELSVSSVASFALDSAGCESSRRASGLQHTERKGDR